MKKTILTAFPALLLSLSLGCAGNSSCSEQADGSDPRDPYRNMIDRYIAGYEKPEVEYPTEFIPGMKGQKGYDAAVKKAQTYYRNVPFFLNTQKWNRVSFTYVGLDKNAERFTLTADREKKEITVALTDAAGKTLFSIPGTQKSDVDPKDADKERDLLLQLLMDPYSKKVSWKKDAKDYELKENFVAESVSVQSAGLLNTETKKVEPSFQQYRIGDEFCYRFDVKVKKAYGGATLRIFTSVDNRQIVRFDLASLKTIPNLSVVVKEYGKGMLPLRIRVNGKDFKLDETSVQMDLKPVPAAAAPAAEKKAEPAKEEVKSAEKSEEPAEEAKPAEKTEEVKAESSESESEDDFPEEE